MKEFMSNALIPPTPSEASYAVLRAADPIVPTDSPFVLFADWLALAQKHEPNDPNAMCLATTDSAGLPDARMVLLKEFEAPYLGFYTNFDSAKGQHLNENPKAALAFHWKSLRRQIRVRGGITRNSREAADAYFASRSRSSQLSAATSKQSHVLQDRADLVVEADAMRARYSEDVPIPRPDNWGGYLLSPISFEFWQDQPYRMHDRVHYTYDKSKDVWGWHRLYP